MKKKTRQRNLMCLIFGHNFDIKKYNKKLNVPELKCIRCGKERLGIEYFVPQKLIKQEKTKSFNIKKYGTKSNYVIEWISVDARYMRNIYEFKKNASSQVNHLDKLGRWNSGVMKIG